MFYDRQELQRFWECKLYKGDPNAKRPKTRTETVIGWNEVDVARKCGGHLAERPKEVCFVYQKVKGGPFFKIESTAGPSDEVMEPSVPYVDATEL